MKNKKILVRDIGKQSFSEAWEYQEKIFKKIINQKVQNRSKDKKIETKNFLIFTEHNHVYTIGKSGDVNNLLIDKEELIKREIEYFKINRGGDITYHGPGQIMAYPIFDLDNFFTDINLYLRKLEQVIIHTLQSYGLKGFTIKGETGVWVKDEDGSSKKICAFGIRASRWVTMHGLALNANVNLEYFDNIVPCGIKNNVVTSMNKELDTNIDQDALKSVIKISFLKVFNATTIE